MAEVKVSIGGREFEVACRDGEEHFLLSAAQLLDNEASALNEALGRMPENRMLLMAGLMLADKTASLEDRLKSAAGGGGGDAGPRAKKLEKQLAEVQAELADAKASLAEAEATAEQARQALTDAQDQAGREAEAARQAAAQRDSALSTLRRIVEKVEQAAAD